MVYSFRGTSYHDSSFLLTKLVETCAQKYHFITPGTFAGILSYIWNKKSSYVKITAGTIN